MKSILALFPFFPRRVGLPSYIINNELEFLNYYTKYNGSEVGCHTSVYDTSQTPIIDKILFEFDGKNLKAVLEEVKQFVDELMVKKYPLITIFSGKKGFHVYVVLKPKEYPLQTAKQLLRLAVGNYIDDLNFVDSSETGTFSMVRIPNSLNQNRYCTPLPPNFLDWSVSKILSYAKTRHPIQTDLESKKLLSLDELVGVSYIPEIDFQPQREPIEISYIPPNLLKNVIRECVWQEIIKERPCHILRVNLVSELYWLGLNEEQIFHTIKQLGWINFNEQITRENIKYIMERKLLPFSCKKLKTYVNCNKCGFKYYWR